MVTDVNFAKPVAAGSLRSRTVKNSILLQHEQRKLSSSKSVCAKPSLPKLTTKNVLLQNLGNTANSTSTGKSLENKLLIGLTRKEEVGPGVGRCLVGLKAPTLTKPPLTAGSKPSVLTNPLLERLNETVASNKGISGPLVNPMLQQRMKTTSLHLRSSGNLHFGSGTRSLTGTKNRLLATSFRHSASSAPSLESSTKNLPVPRQPQDFHQVDVPAICHEDLEKLEFDDDEVTFPTSNEMLSISKRPDPPLVLAKTDLIGCVCTSLINNPVWFSPKDKTRMALHDLCENISEKDPEFILKVALYTRLVLNIRATCNFLLALASYLPSCRPYLKKYFCKAIVLPSDWIQVSEFHQSLSEQEPGGVKFPSALRKVMVMKFPEFDTYQLGKYNKDKAKKKKGPNKKEKKEESKEEKKEESSEDAPDKPKLNVPMFTLKYLIRKLHLTKPAYPVMCILGKKYPDSVDSYYKAGLEGTWDSTLSGKRMKLQVPETWETQISAKGNHAEVWEDLLSHRKLPFMAMLRNIRNMIKAGISEKFHSQVLKTLTNERAVTKSRQFPFRFFSAYEVLKELETDIEKAGKYKEHGLKLFLTKEQQQLAKSWQYGNLFKTKSKELKHIDYLRRVIHKKYGKPLPFDEQLIARYRKALNEAVKISTLHNVPPIVGHTIVICDVRPETLKKKCSTSKGLGSTRTVAEVGILLGLMCAYSSEACTLMVCSGKMCKTIELENGGILKNLARIVELVSIYETSGKNRRFLPSGFFQEAIIDRIKFNNLLVLSSTLEEEEDNQLASFLDRYSDNINSEAKCYTVDLTGKRLSMSPGQGRQNITKFSGFSEQILKYIALGSGKSQLNCVSSVDKKFNLESDEVVSLATGMQQMTLMRQPLQKPWKTIRIFISSTIKDMTSERNALVQYVFPTLQRRARDRCLHLVETDLRWGITADDSHYGRSIQICLEEVRKCDIFIGVLGERYGWVPKEYGFPEPGMEWLNNYPKGRSITELEINQAAFADHDHGKNCLFYFRDPAELKKGVPKAVKNTFFESNSHKRSKLNDLKARIRDSEHPLLEDYPVEWGGIVKGSPTVQNLDAFVERVMDDIWGTVDHLAAMEDDVVQDDVHLRVAAEQNFEGRLPLLASLRNKVTNAKSDVGNVVAIVGKPGSGKSALITAVHNELAGDVQDCLSCIHYVTPSIPGSESVTNILHRFCTQIGRTFHFPDKEIPSDYDGLFKVYTEFVENLDRSSSKPKIYLMVDNLHSLDCDIDWIEKISHRLVTVLVTCLEASNIHNALKHVAGVVFQQVTDPTASDKRSIVRSMLGKHSKKLDESHFNNQMQVLLSKRQSSSPLYLSTVCEMMRMQETFESLSGTLKSLPHDLDGVLEWQLDVVEARFAEYPGLVATTLGMLHCSMKWKISEEDLYDAVCLRYWKPETTSKMACTTYDSEEGGNLPRAVFFSLLYSLKSFITTSPSENGNLLTLSHVVHVQLVERRYIADQKFTQSCPTALANLHTKKMRDHLAQSNRDAFVISEALSRIPLHLASARRYDVLRNLLTDFDYIQIKCRLRLGTQLLSEYTLLENSSTKTKGFNAKSVGTTLPWQEMQRFITRHIDMISKHPEMIYQFALNQAWDSYPYTVAYEAVCAGHKSEAVTFLEHLNRFEGPESCVCSYKAGNSEVETSIAEFHGGSFLAYGSDSGKVGVFDKTTGNDVYAWSGHSDTISSLSFVNKSILLSACAGGTVSMWDVAEGFRIRSFKAHDAKITGMSVKPARQGGAARVFVTSSLDRSIGIWKVSDGKFQSRLKSDGSPANCVAFHPKDPRVVVGLWDCTLRVWDVQTLKRVAVIRGHLQAVSSVQYSICGTYIASCSFFESVIRLWAAGAGIPLGNFGETFLTSPTALTFSSEGKYLIGAGEGTNEHCSQMVTWSSRLGKEELKYGVPDASEAGNATFCSFNSDKTTLAVGYHSGNISIYDAKAPAPLFTGLVHDSPVTCMVWTPGPGAGLFSSLLFDTSPELLISGSTDGTLKAIDPHSLTVVATFTSHTAGVLAVDCSFEWIASGSEDFDILLWPLKDISGPVKGFLEGEMRTQNSNVNLGEVGPVAVKSSKTLRGHEGPVACLAFNPEGTMLVSGGRDGKLAYWSMANCDKDFQGNVQHRNVSHTKKDIEPVAVIDQAHMDWITCCSWNDSSDHIVTGSNDANLKIWSVPKLPLPITKEFSTPLYILKGHQAGITSVKYRLGCISSTGGEDNTIKIWSHRGVEITSLMTPSRTNCCDVSLQAELETNPLEGPLNFDDEDVEEFDTKESDGQEYNWAEEVAADEWKEEHEKCKPGSKKKKEVVTAKMRKFQVVCASSNAIVSLWKPLVGDRLNVLNCHYKSISRIEATNESQLLTCSSAGSIQLWNTAACDEKTLRHDGEVTCVMSLDQFILTSCDAGFIYVWSIDGEGYNATLVCKKAAHKKRITSMKLLKGLVFVTTSHDGSVTIWDVAVTEALKIRNVVLQKKVTKLTGSPLHACCVDSSSNGWQLCVWDLEGSGRKYEVAGDFSTLSSSSPCSSSALSGRMLSIATSSGSLTFTDKGEFVSEEQSCLQLEDGAFVHSYAMVCGLSMHSSEDLFIAGCSLGYLHVPSQKRKIKIHDSRVTVLLDAGKFLVSGSFDCTLKLWRKPDLLQIGYFSASSPVTAGYFDMSRSLVMYGDSSGMLNVLKVR